MLGGMSKKSKAEGKSKDIPFEREIQELERRITELRELKDTTSFDVSGEIASLEQRLEEALSSAYENLSPWERVGVARHPERPVTSDYIELGLDHFVELHGDRTFGDDRAMVTGLATMGHRRFVLVGHRKGKTVKDRLACNFGCAHPEGYRKAWRKMKLAEKLGLPLVCLVNTPGAYPGIGAEERGQAMAIAENILGMFGLKVPIIVLIIGEGGSGGALGIGIGDRVLMMEHAYYSVISPEGCAAILWKDGERSPEAAAALKLTSKDLIKLEIIDEVVPEPLGGAHRDPAGTVQNVRELLLDKLDELDAIPIDALVAQRREKFRRMAAIEGRFPVLAS